MESLQNEHLEIERKIFDFGLELLRPWYNKRREFAATITKFWPTAIEKSELLGEYITYEDSEIFDSLIDFHIEWDANDSKIYAISFVFTSNKYFDGCTLTKSFDQKSQTSEPLKINWKPDMDLCSDSEGREPSFFKWFAETKEAAFEIGHVLCEDFFPHALDFYQYDEGEQLEEYDISDSE